MSSRITLIFIWLIVSTTASFANDALVAKLLQSETEPVGVVFEIIEAHEEDLRWAFGQIAGYSRQLKQKFPDIEIAVVSHGGEQFGLLAADRDVFPKVHEQAETWRREGVDLHVCGVHAGWRGNVPEDFPDYVDVADSGPAQIRLYEDYGYEVIPIARSRD